MTTIFESDVYTRKVFTFSPWLVYTLKMIHNYRANLMIAMDFETRVLIMIAFSFPTITEVVSSKQEYANLFRYAYL